MKLNDGIFQREGRRKGLEVAMRSQEDSILPLGSVVQGKGRK
jgi:hypothetical protein